jgi:hypothetical protein
MQSQSHSSQIFKRRSPVATSASTTTPVVTTTAAHNAGALRMLLMAGAPLASTAASISHTNPRISLISYKGSDCHTAPNIWFQLQPLPRELANMHCVSTWEYYQSITCVHCMAQRMHAACRGPSCSWGSEARKQFVPASGLKFSKLALPDVRSMLFDHEACMHDP